MNNILRFNPYIWNLYKNSSQGKKEIATWKKLQNFDFLLAELTNCIEDKQIKKENINFIQQAYKHFAAKKFEPNKAEKFFTEWISEGIPIDNGDDELYIVKNAPLDWCWVISNQAFLTASLYSLHPEFFFPWLFFTSCENFNFATFQHICLEFEIPLPPSPLRKDKLKRAIYYSIICQSLNEFRLRFNLLPEELCAFIYDFAPNTLELLNNKKEANELPEPTKVWYIVENSISNGWLDDINFDNSPMRWQLNPMTAIGDILILYCAKPHSAIHSMWRATGTFHIDPFYEWYKVGYIAQPIVLPKITLKEARTNSILSKNSKVRCNFWSGNGSPVPYAEYTEMLRLWQEKGMDTSKLPKITPLDGLDESITLLNERDVELQLVEPLLLKLGYNAEREGDWTRQMPVKMGTGLRYYPDYCFYTNQTYGEESARFILETKYRISSKKQLEAAFYQAYSYATRLQAHIFALAAQDGLWVFTKTKEKFAMTNQQFYHWQELADQDNFHALSQLIGKKAIGKKR